MPKPAAPFHAVDAWHALAPPQVLAALYSDGGQGLTQAEAGRRLATHGPNALPETPPRPL